jgi:uncharacterized glyoxalase superfamily protein PhnB
MAFGFEVDVEHKNPAGDIVHAELHLGPGVVGVSTANAPTPDNPWSAVRQGIYVRVADVDAHHDRARRAGAEIATPLKDMDYGSREYSVRDPDGHLWGFGTYDMAGTHTGEPNLFVGLHYRDPRAALAWLERVFGFEKTVEIPGPNGSIMHAEMRYGPGTIFVGPAHEKTTQPGGNPQGIYFYHPDPDAHLVRAKQTGARIIRGPETTSYGARAYYAQDPEGFLWGFSTYKPENAISHQPSAISH